jgi:hypothetical protein
MGVFAGTRTSRPWKENATMRTIFLLAKDAPAPHMALVFRSALAVAALIFATADGCQAGYVLGDSANYAALFEGAGNNHLQFNNGTINGNIGLGDPSGSTTAQLQLSGGAANTILNGNAQFAGATTNVAGTAGTDYSITAGHTISAGHTNVQTDLNDLNALSTTLGSEAGTGLAISIGNGGNQTVNAASGTLDANGNRVFDVSSIAFVNGATLTVNGDGAGDSVVFNFTHDASFGGTILLTGGLTADQVLFNITGGSGLTGGHTLTISTNGATETGVFLDPNGTISMNHALLNGRLFGGDTHDDAIVSGANINAPSPEPSTLLVAGFGSAGALLLRRKKQ